MPDDDDDIIRGLPNEGWAVYRKLILAELKRLSAQVAGLDAKLDRFRDDDIRKIWVELTVLKVKAAFWGAIAGSGLGLGISVIAHFINGKS